MKKSLIYIALSIIPFYVSADNDAPYDFPIDGEMAHTLKPVIVGATDEINSSVRVSFLEATEKDVTIMVVIGAIDTTKPRDEAKKIDEKTIKYTKQNITNSYCAPFGAGNWLFDTFRQRKVTLDYYFSAGSEVPLFSFKVSEKDCTT